MRPSISHVPATTKTPMPSATTAPAVPRPGRARAATPCSNNGGKLVRGMRAAIVISNRAPTHSTIAKPANAPAKARALRHSPPSTRATSSRPTSNTPHAHHCNKRGACNGSASWRKARTGGTCHTATSGGKANSNATATPTLAPYRGASQSKRKVKASGNTPGSNDGKANGSREPANAPSRLAKSASPATCTNCTHMTSRGRRPMTRWTAMAPARASRCACTSWATPAPPKHRAKSATSASQFSTRSMERRNAGCASRAVSTRR